MVKGRFGVALFGFEGTLKYLYTEKSRDNSEEDTPVPISNTVVKLFIADDTWLEAAWESRKSRVFLFLGKMTIYGHLL